MKKFGKSIKNLWLLDDDVTYLNHGSYGATPIKIIETAEKIQRELEREPVSFFADSFFDRTRKVAAELANFIGSQQDNLVLVDNATSAINTVLRSLLPSLTEKDEIIITNHTYPAVKMACKYIADISRCRITEIKIPFPFDSANDLIKIYKNKLSKNTKLVILDHIFYTTGVINPVKEIAKYIKSENIPVLVDGAHVPGMLPLDIELLGVDWYTGNCHKWLFAPKGSAFLWTAPAKQDITKPLSISYYYGESYTKEFDWTGTRNPTPVLALSDAINFHRDMGSDEIYTYIHNLAIEARHLIAEKLNLQTDIPDNFFGAMVSFELKNVKPKGNNFVNELRQQFFNNYKIEVPFTEFDNRVFIRFSAQIYNELEDYKKLVYAMKKFFPQIQS